jgi:hypothetical protein
VTASVHRLAPSRIMPATAAPSGLDIRKLAEGVELESNILCPPWAATYSI